MKTPTPVCRDRHFFGSKLGKRRHLCPTCKTKSPAADLRLCDSGYEGRIISKCTSKNNAMRCKIRWIQFDFDPCHITKGTGSPDFFQIFPGIFFQAFCSTAEDHKPPTTNHQPVGNSARPSVSRRNVQISPNAYARFKVHLRFDYGFFGMRLVLI